MAEVSVLSPSRSDPGAACTPADVLVDRVDVNVEDDGGGAGSDPSVISSDSDRTLEDPQTANTNTANGSTPTHNSCQADAIRSLRTHAEADADVRDETASDPGPGPWPQTSPNCTLDQLISPAGNKRRSTTAEPEDDDDHQGGKKKRHRRKNKGGKHHRKWKPYTKMTWEEKKNLEERESRRAVQKRQHMAACGQPMAPYNTTQFLMEQHEDAELTLEDRVTRPGKSEGSGSVESSDEYYESPNDEQEIFLEKDFTEAYESFHAERLQAMTKDELVREYLQLESKVERLECRLRDVGENNCERGDTRIVEEGKPKAEHPSQTSELAPELSAASKLRLEIQRLQTENGKLTRENQGLRERWKQLEPDK